MSVPTKGAIMLTVTQLARECGLSRTTILYYEREGLLAPAHRSENGYRWYGENEISDGGPGWLFSEIGVERLRDEKGKHITNFNNEKFISEAREAIKALSMRYDSDPRIYAFQLGVIGYWGEWHSYGFSEDFYLTHETKNQILGIYKDNFKNKKLMGRYPWIEPLKSTGGIGFHNDYFGPVQHSNEFDEAIFDGNKWIEGPIGGEYPPQISQNDFTSFTNKEKKIFAAMRHVT